TEVVQAIMKKEMKKSMTCLSHLHWAVKWLMWTLICCKTCYVTLMTQL
uniref:Uncharacterized protein n=1 Tax=Oryza glaberrima TaxID=4538 RepID=I1QWE3_ORYGL